MRDTPDSRAYTPDQLQAQAFRFTQVWDVPRKWREDAVQEFVIAGAAVANAPDRGLRACQHRCGKNALLDFLKREARAEARHPAECLPKAKRISLDMPVPGMNGEPTTLAETVRDRDAPDPSDRMQEGDLKKAVARAMRRLTPEEAEATRRVFIAEETQKTASLAMGLTRDQLRSRLASAVPILRIWLAGYRALAGQ